MSQSNSEKKIILRKKPKPRDWLPEPVESYAWKEDGIYTEPTNAKWLLPNNPNFLDWINEKYYDFRLEVEEVKGKVNAPSPYNQEPETKSSKKDLFLYQKFIQNYITPKSPYRGILVYHKLGSGKTRTAIATAEPFRKAGFNVIVLLPASLKNNFIDEIKNWGNSDLALPDNFAELSKQEQQQIDHECTKKIQEKYKFVSYNANNTIKELSKVNLKDAIVIIDEVHNLLNMMTSSQSKQGKHIYKTLMSAQNCRFVALSGTPLLNFSYELALLFNILRGYMSLQDKHLIPLFPENEVEFEEYFVDYVTERAKNMELFKRRIVGLVSYYCGTQEELYPELFLHEPIHVPMSGHQFSHYWQLRQEEKATESKSSWKGKGTLTDFSDGHMPTSKSSLQKSRKHLVSNTFRPNSRQGCNFAFPEHINRPKSLSKTTKEVLSKVKMDLDPEKWTQAQKSELEILFQRQITTNGDNNTLDTNEKEIELDLEAYEEFIDTWRGFTSKKECLEFLIETIETRGYLGQFTEIASRDEETLVLSPETHEMGTRRALKELGFCQNEVLSQQNLPKYSAKMAQIVHNMETGDGKAGKKFIFSNFRTLEGVEIFSRVLQVRGYQLFNPNRSDDKTNPGLRYAIISGTESSELRKEILKNFNRRDNAHGEYLMVLLGTSASAEGISLKHVRQIHIMEPWWNEVRLQQVVGRGRRIGSHLDLPEDERNVHVFQYLSVLTDMQKETLRKDPKEYETTDEHIFGKARSKAKINKQFSHVLMESALDSVLNAAHNQNLKHGIYPIEVPKTLQHLFVPMIEKERLLRYQSSSAISNTNNSNTNNTNNSNTNNSNTNNNNNVDAYNPDEFELIRFATFKMELKSRKLSGAQEQDPVFKGLYDPNTKKPLYVVMIDDKNAFRKLFVYKVNDLKKLCYSAFALYDRIAAETSHRFLLRGYLVDKLGLVKKDDIIVCDNKLS